MSKCKYYKVCRLFNPDHEVCTSKNGMYYDNYKKPAGCFRDIEAKGSKSTYIKKEYKNVAFK